ncbi:hypothetical protein DES53_104267 [Roseimicrobium gellanilyticum]|uniref:VanZ like protein n=1 Tax=Roseimicrobium gellanilyticum TaxID=748857 RepID=A0A366HMS3_9BACT|nr:hypothetical protein [Roseimicrobium gellanilyticum]RBP44447.1 hypothetical protein DES53_104267 [Roseimicrobium gellanilyticum]
MSRFRYLLDPLCLTGCALYALNRWAVKPHTTVEFFHYYFNDLWLIPCALPPLLWLHRKLSLRAHDRFPSSAEVLLHLGIWCVICEGIGPRWVPGTSGDYRDVLAYASGAILALCWWRWQEKRSPVSGREPLNA